MCVIIYVPKTSTISLEEIKQAWNTNPDGAGYSIQKDGVVVFKRGFMDLGSYLKEITPLIGNYNLLLHFRISTSKSVNEVQTHPYKKGNVTLTQGTTKRPVICMNGIISGQREYKGCNDTMSYIVDHTKAFSVINQDILDIIESDTGAKWAVMLPDKVLLSSKFKYDEGKYYSNQNHLWRSLRTIYTYNKKQTKKNFNNIIKNKSLQRQIRKNKELHDEVLDFIDIWCNYGEEEGLCGLCTKCLKNAKTLKDIKLTLDENYYGEYNYLQQDNSCILDDYYRDSDYNDVYDYGKEIDYLNLNNIFDE